MGRQAANIRLSRLGLNLLETGRSNLATLVGTYFGSRLLKERIGWSRAAGALCIVLGVICLAAADS